MNTVLCLGNILMKDDGIGIIIGNLLRKKLKKADIYICETDIYYAQSIIDEVHELIVVDAVDLGVSPGSTIQIPIDNIKPKCFSLHDFTYDFKGKKGLLYGIQIKEIILELGISIELQNNLKRYIKEVSDLL